MAKRSNAIITAIAVFKLVKAVALIAFGIIALRGVNHDLHGLEWFAPSNAHVHRAITRLSGTSAAKLQALSIGTFVYAAVFLIEGVGLLLRKRWAEYLTVIITASFIPLEIYELVVHSSAAKIATIVINAAVVVYLIVRLRSERAD